LITLFLSYPLDLASAKIMSDLKNKENAKYTNVTDVFSKISAAENKFYFMKYYRGVSLAIAESFPQAFITLLGCDIIYRYHNLTLKETDNILIRYWKLFGCMATLSFLTSSITYPLNTIKKRIQVHNSLDFSHENKGVFYAINYMKNNLKTEMYR
jgi:hypothetical protein